MRVIGKQNPVAGCVLPQECSEGGHRGNRLTVNLLPRQKDGGTLVFPVPVPTLPSLSRLWLLQFCLRPSAEKRIRIQGFFAETHHPLKQLVPNQSNG